MDVIPPISAFSPRYCFVYQDRKSWHLFSRSDSGSFLSREKVSVEAWQGQAVVLGALSAGLLMVCCDLGTLLSFLRICPSSPHESQRRQDCIPRSRSLAQSRPLSHFVLSKAWERGNLLTTRGKCPQSSYRHAVTFILYQLLAIQT